MVMASRASEKQPGKYRADVDGMRALAVVLVVLNHVGLGFAGGYVGVDVFFVISGYLITGIVWRELLAGSFSFGGFYERRARRILPAFGVTALVTLAAGWYLLLPYEYKLLGRSVVAASLGFSNITFWGESGYFDMAAAEKPFLHTWSLGVEEQFYLVLPGLMFVLFRLGLGRWLPGVFVGLFAASLGLSVWLLESQPGFTFYWLPTRAWELMAGSLLALAPMWRVEKRIWREILAVLGLGLIVGPALFYGKETAFPGMAAMAPVLGAVLLIGGGSAGGSLVRAMLEWRPVVFVGVISYSLYLVHWPMMAFANYLAMGPMGAVGKLMLVAVSVVLAIVSWWLVERPFRGKGLIVSRRMMFVFAGVVVGVVVSGGMFVQKRHGFPWRLEAEGRAILETQRVDSRWWGIDLHALDVPERLAPFGAVGKRPEVLVWGDSHAKALLPGLDELFKQHGISGVAAIHSGVPPVAGLTRKFQEFSPEDLVEYGEKVLLAAAELKVSHVVLACYWESYSKGNRELFREAVFGTVARLRELGITPCFVEDVPVFFYHLGITRVMCLGFRGRAGLGAPRGLTEKEYESQTVFQREIRQELEEMGALVFAPARYLRRGDGLEGYYANDGDASFYIDKDHLSVRGAMVVRGAFEGLLQRRVAVGR